MLDKLVLVSWTFPFALHKVFQGCSSNCHIPHLPKNDQLLTYMDMDCLKGIHMYMLGWCKVVCDASKTEPAVCVHSYACSGCNMSLLIVVIVGASVQHKTLLLSMSFFASKPSRQKHCKNAVCCAKFGLQPPRKKMKQQRARRFL